MTEVSTARKGLNALLEREATAEVALITNQNGKIRSALREALHPSNDGHTFADDMNGPWTCVDLYNYDGERGDIRRFAIWNKTGNVYSIDLNGSIEDGAVIEFVPDEEPEVDQKTREESR